MQTRPSWVFLVKCSWFLLEPIDHVAHHTNMQEVGITPSPTLDWRGWLNLWADQHAATGSELYAEQHRRRVGFFMEHLGLSSFDDVSPRHAAMWFAMLSREGQPAPNGRQRPCSAKTLHSHKAAMVRFWRWLVTMEAIPPKPHTPFDGLQIPRAEQRDQRAFTVDEAGTLIAWAERDERVVRSVRYRSADDPQMIREESAFDPTNAHKTPQRTPDDAQPQLYRSSLYLLLSCIGLRVGEAARVRWSDLELDADPATLAVQAHKGKRRRGASYALPEPLRAALLYQRQMTRPEPRDAVWPFLSAYQPNRARRVLVNDCKGAGVTVEDARGRRAGWHCFRRLVGTELARAGVSPAVAQRVLGHADPSTTLKHYTVVGEAEKTAAINIVSRRIYGQDTGKSDQKPSSALNGDADDVRCSSHARNHEHNRDSEHQPPGVTSQAGLDRIVQGASPPPHGDREQRCRFESCIAHYDANERLLWHASQMLAAAAEIAARLPKGSRREQHHTDQFKEPS